MKQEDKVLPFEQVKREIVERVKAKTDAKFGSAPEQRSVSGIIDYGIINIDKPSGPTSHQVSAYVQQILRIKKSGHSGTLDPGVTGVLAVALGRATRIVQALLPAGKEYICLMRVHKPVDKEVLLNAINNYTGQITQMPPIRSAVKRQYRQRRIYYVDVIEIDSQDVLFKIGCQAGTYIRKYCFDFGQKIGVGAHMAELRRTRAGPFDESTAVTLHDVMDAYYYWKEEGNEEMIKKIIQPVENAVAHLPKIWILDSAVNSLCHGADLNVPGISLFETGIEKEDTVAIMTLKGELVCLGTAVLASSQMKAEYGLAVKTDKVFMLADTYPKIPKQ